LSERGGDILCEMRFYVPNMEETESQQEKQENKEKKDENDEKSENSDEEITPAKIMNDQIL
jgi:predicted phage gp36 major capsid-like protein